MPRPASVTTGRATNIISLVELLTEARELGLNISQASAKLGNLVLWPTDKVQQLRRESIGVVEAAEGRQIVVVSLEQLETL